MDLNFDLELVYSQKILLTPQLKQAFEILKMNSQELFEYVEEQITYNPVLEFYENEPGTMSEDTALGAGHTSASDTDTFFGCFDAHTDDRDSGMEENSGASPFMRISLKEHLLFQLHMSCLDRNQLPIGEYLIDNIDKNGYLAISLLETARYFNIDVGKVIDVMEVVQTFDPPGICARDLRECLLIQLRYVSNADSDMINIIENYLDHLASGKLQEIAKNACLDMERVEKIFGIIKTLEPKPGREYCGADDLRLIISDVVIKKIKDKNEVLMNEDSIPLLNINEYYRRILTLDVSDEVKKFVMNKIDRAVWLIKCIEQRRVMLTKIAVCIVSMQNEFFEKGKRFIIPVAFQKGANNLNIHESILRNITCGKYIQCQWGIFEMSSFFA